jgi:hypothetical protein
MLKCWVDNTGKLIYFGTYYTGGYSPITNLKSNPAIMVNGNIVPTSSGMFFSTAKDTPIIAYQFLCGQLERVAFSNAGYNYTNPTVTCPGVVFGEPITTTGITRYNIRNNGNPFTATPSISIAQPTQVLLSQVLLKAYVAGSNSGTVTSIKPTVDNTLSRRQIPIGTPITVSVGVGINCALAPTIVSGQITAITVPASLNGTNAGSTYPATVQLNIWDKTGSGASGTITTAGGVVQRVTMQSFGHNYTNPSFTIAPVGNNITVEPVIESYIQWIPVISSAFFYSPPTISVTDPTGSGAILVPVMGGVGPTDVVTYSTVANWITATNTTVTATGNALADNWVGQKEQSTPFDIPSFTGYIKLGVNYGEQPIGISFPYNPVQNKVLQGSWGGVSNTKPVLDAHQGLLSWTNPTQGFISRTIYSPTTNNQVDNQYSPSQTGNCFLTYDDPFVNTTLATMVRLNGNGTNTKCQILNLSGPNEGTYNSITVNPNDIFIASGSLVGITTKSTNFGSGYQAALAVISGSVGTYAIALPIVKNGLINSFAIISSGINYSATNKPIINVYGLGSAGNTVSGVFNVTYIPNNITRNAGITVSMAQTSGLYLIQNLAVTLPDPVTGLPQPYDKNDPLSPDVSVVYGLSGIDCIRHMDVTGGYGGPNNYTTEHDLMNSSWGNWDTANNISATFQFARAVNTNPANTGYSFYCDRVYGLQEIYCDGTDSFGNYKLLPTSDSGNFTSNYTSWQGVVLELRSITPHGLTTGQTAVVSSPSANSRIPVTNAISTVPSFPSTLVWVTGPNTVVALGYIPSYVKTTAPQVNPPQTIASNQEIDLTISGAIAGWKLTVSKPISPASAPFDFCSRMSEKTGAAYWLNIPPAYTSGMICAITKQVSKNIDVYLEFNNEIWNGGQYTRGFIQSYNNFLGYLPSGTKFGKYYTSNGSRPPYECYGASLLMSAHAQDLFQEYSGMDPARIHRVIGSWYNTSLITAEICENAHAWNIPVDHIAIAPYYSFPGDVTINPLVSLVGTNNAVNPGGLPPDAFNSLVRHWMMYNNTNANYWSQHMAVLANFGQPVQMAQLAVLNPSGGNLPTGRFSVYYTFADASGLETTVGLSQSFSQAYTGQIWKFIAPNLPYWATTMNVYVQYNGPPVLFQKYPKGSFLPGQNIALTGFMSANNINPPTVNLASGYITKKPTLVTYEGGVAQLATFSPYPNVINHDCYADPSMVEVVRNWWQNCAYRGATLATYYQAYNLPYNFFLAMGTQQVPGSGLNNQYSIAGYPADAADHSDDNQATALFGMRSLIKSVTPVQPPTTAIMSDWRVGLYSYFR